MVRRIAVGVQKSWKAYLGFALLLGSVGVSFAQDTRKSQVSEVVITRENLYSFSTGTDCKSVPYTGLQEGRIFMIAESFIRMELWTQEGMGTPLQERRRLVDSKVYLYQGNAYADWYPKINPTGVCPQLKERLEPFPKELESMLGLVQNGTAQLDPPCEPAIALTVNGNQVVQSYAFVTDCGAR